MSRTASQAAPSSSHHAIKSDNSIGRTLHAMTQGKGAGMTEGEWNQIVMKNVQAEKEEHQRKKDLILKQREEMKAELARQVEVKKSLAEAQKRKEVAAFSTDIGLTNSKIDAEQARRV